LLAVISAYDFKFIAKQECLEMLEKMLTTVCKLTKWNGHLYNWYDTKTLIPLNPKYISTVDSGNLVGYLYVLKQALIEMEESNLLNIVNMLIENTSFEPLYNHKNRLFSIGFNIEENNLTDSYYDLLASEARQASLIAIAKKDVDFKHWKNLNRTLTVHNKHKGLISWTGTAFEYLMPNINIKKYEGTLLSESCKFMIESQKQYAKFLNIPWGISESAFYLKDLYYNFQYKAFGIPWLGLKRGLGDDIVVSAYGSAMALSDVPNEVIKNLKNLKESDMYGEYGFYDAIDYTPERLSIGQTYAPVKVYMAHHQGLILLSINNFINENILPKRFSKNPEIEAVDILLQEVMPEKTIVTKEKRERVEKLKYRDYENMTESIYTTIKNDLANANLISNENYTVAITTKGEGYSKYKNIYVNRFKNTEDEFQGIEFYIKNIKSKRIWTSGINNYLTKADKYSAMFSYWRSKFTRTDGNIDTITNVTISPDEPMEMRRVELRNNGNLEEILEVTSVFEPILSRLETDISHKAFNNLFLTYEMLENNILLITRKRRMPNEQDIFMGINLLTAGEVIGELEFEIDKEKFAGRNNFNLPKSIENSRPLSKQLGVTTEPIVALKRTVKLNPGETISLDFCICVSNNKEEVEEMLEKYQNEENRERIFELAKARAELETRYLNLKGKEVEIYKKIFSLLMYQNPTKVLEKELKKEYAKEGIWKFGISGDLPIILVKIKQVSDIFVVEELIKAHEFLKMKNIKTDLIILNKEKNIYEQYVKNSIYSIIANNHAYDGVYLLNPAETEKSDEELLEFRANIVFDASFGAIEITLKEMEEEYINGRDE